MIREHASVAKAQLHFYAGRLSFFDHIAHGFPKAVANYPKSGLFAILNYLDGTVMIGGTARTRRVAVLAMEDLKQHIEAPFTLQSQARAQISLPKLNSIPKFKLYGDNATAILRMYSALRTRVRVISIEETVGALELWRARPSAVNGAKPADVILFNASA
jgi:hypothetical protein